MQFLPAPIVAAYFIAQFFLNKDIISYAIFVVAAVVPLIWFVVHNFWYLNIWLGGAPLQTVCKYIIGGAVVAMGVPGLALLPLKARFAAEVGLVSHALIVCHLENRLYNFTSIYYFSMEDDVVYPSYMVVFTTVLGLVLVHRLSADKRISSVSNWLMICLYLSKLSMLFLSSPHVVWAAALLLLAITPPLLLYKYVLTTFFLLLVSAPQSAIVVFRDDHLDFFGIQRVSIFLKFDIINCRTYRH